MNSIFDIFEQDPFFNSIKPQFFTDETLLFSNPWRLIPNYLAIGQQQQAQNKDQDDFIERKYQQLKKLRQLKKQRLQEKQQRKKINKFNNLWNHSFFQDDSDSDSSQKLPKIQNKKIKKSAQKSKLVRKSQSEKQQKPTNSNSDQIQEEENMKSKSQQLEQQSQQQQEAVQIQNNNEIESQQLGNITKEIQPSSSKKITDLIQNLQTLDASSKNQEELKQQISKHVENLKQKGFQVIENSNKTDEKDLVIMGKKNIKKDNFKAKEKIIYMNDKQNPNQKFTSYSKSTQHTDGNYSSTSYSSYSYKSI